MKDTKEFNHKEITEKWQKEWEKHEVFKTQNHSKKKKFYLLVMFPYPSASGLHMGHALNYTIGDIFARFKIMQGYNVLHPMGFDSFGLPAENAAIKEKAHPKKFTEEAIKNYTKQMKGLGLSYDWSRTVATHREDYYKWDQWLFLKMYEKGLAYKKKSPVNWCPKCNTVLANEQVHNGKCWRHEETEVVVKNLEQWFLKTTAYADELYEGIDSLKEWPEMIKKLQKNWIGKSHGTEIDFRVDGKISKIVLIHGKDTNPLEKWYPHFVKQMKAQGIEVIVPSFPIVNPPVLKDWLQEIEKTNPDKDTILIGHSRGGVAILRWLENQKENQKVKKVILLATNRGDEPDAAAGDFFGGDYDFKKIKKHCDDFVVFHSKDDEWVPFSHGEHIATGLSAKFNIYENKGHFGKNLNGDFPELEEEIVKTWKVFTTRADTLMGVTFLVVSAQHPRLQELVTPEQKGAVEEFLKGQHSVKQEDIDQLEKEGVFTGSYAEHPLTKEKIPVYAGNFVLADYGSGMVMAVPAHDQRDYEFAKKYGAKTEDKTNAIIVHGSPTSEDNNPETRTYDKHWMPWTKKELIKNGISTEAPLMPTPWLPKYEAWKKEFEKYEVTENTILIGTSCGCSFLVRWLGDTKRRISKLILVAPRKIQSVQENKAWENATKEFYNYEIDRSIKSRVKEIIFFSSDNAPNEDKESVKIFHDALGGRIIDLPGRGHYMRKDMGAEEFPELLQEVLNSCSENQGIKIKWVVMPSYGESHAHEEKRYTVSAVVKRKSDSKYLLVKWKEFGWIAPVVGGIDEGETSEQAAVREVLEETGFKTKAIKKLGGPVETRFYAENKKVWRHRIDQPVLLEIIDDKQQEIVDEEKNKHDIVWLSAEDALKQMTHEDNNRGIKIIEKGESAFTDYGVLVNSGEFDGLTSEEAIKKITETLHHKKLGKKITNFRLRDWLISRQRFWGTPIPIVYCDKCGAVPVEEDDLPVKLPENVTFSDVKNPLTEYEPFLNTKCPKCKGPARRETDTMDTFVNSSWYYLRYADPINDKKIFDKKLAEHWAPVDLYIGGKEHACMHLIYVRFYTKFLRDMGLLKFDEPALRLFNQGMLLGPDGEKMSKSKGNVILPETVSEKYGLDAARLFLVSVASPDKDINWSDKGVEGSVRFLNKVVNYAATVKFGESSKKTKSKLHKTIKEVTEDIENLNYNIAVIKVRELFESLEEEISKKDFELCLKLLAPFCPHTCEELWESTGEKKFISLADWPEYDEKMIDHKIDYLDALYENLRGDVHDVLNLIKIEKPSEIKIIVSPEWKYHFAKEFKKAFSESKDFKEISQKLLSGDLKKYGQEVMKTIPALMKDQSKIPGVILSSKQERENLEENKAKLEKEFSCEIIIEEADHSSEQKARNAWPGKPALVVK